LHILDYKTGSPPTDKMQRAFDKQLLREAAMARRGAFGPDLPTDVARISYIGLGAEPKEVSKEITDNVTDTVWEDLHTLIRRYLQRTTGYAARRAVFEDRVEGDYDHLARFGEWGMSDRAHPEDVGGAE
jgi:RecB family exonuclease